MRVCSTHVAGRGASAIPAVAQVGPYGVTDAVDLAESSLERGRAEAAVRGPGDARFVHQCLRRIALVAIGMLPDGNDSASAPARDGMALPFELP